jgi:membrane-bound serine protease (ClpP class)
MRGTRLFAAGFTLVALLGLPAAAASSDQVVGLTLTGVVDPFEASYLAGGIESAEADGAAAVLLTIDTPGGLDSSMRKIIQSILNANVPVLCFVSPSGARAASAGAFILLSCDVAAMAPGTNVGAASPVGVSGAIEQSKAENDAAAYIRSLAEDKDRNADWAESAVRDAVSASAEEALSLGVIDAIEPSVAELFADFDGRTIEKNETTLTIETAGAELVEEKMGAGTSLLHGLLTPDLAFLFFYLGIGLIIVEFLSPGISVPGVLGVLSLLAAFTSFGMLPVQLIGVSLLIASAGLFLLELKNPGISVAGGSGMVALIAGGLWLFDPSVPGVSVSWWVILPVALVMAGFFGIAAPAALRTRKMPVQTGVERLVGSEGVALQDLAPKGTVRVLGEQWTAEAVGTTISRGERVEVKAVEGLRLKVGPASHVINEAVVEQTGGRS